jgi:uncharacterized repeat protein (TIGR01451 family)
MQPRQTNLRRPNPRGIWLTAAITGGVLVSNATAAFGVITPSAIFNPANTNQGTKSQFTLTLGNNSLTAVAGLAIANTPLPAGTRLSTTPIVSNTCGGTPVAAPLATSFSLSGGAIPPLAAGADGECKIVLELIATGGGNQIVTIAANTITGTGGETNPQTATATLGVKGFQKMGTTVTFGPTLIPLPGSSKMTIRFDNPNGIELTGAKFISGLPAGLQIKGTTFSTNTCGGTLTPTGGPPPTGFTLTGGVIPAGGCEFSWEIEGDLPGGASQSDFTYSFADGIVETDQFVSNNAGTGTLTVQQGLRVQQSLSRASAGPGGAGEGGTLEIFTGETATLKLSLSNAGGALTNVNLNQALPAGLVIADNVTTSTCGMTIVANPGDPNFSFTTGAIPAATATALQPCELTVNVKAAAAGTYLNSIAINTISNTEASKNLNASAVTLKVIDITAGGGTGIGVGINFVGGMNSAFYAGNAISAGNEARMNIDIYNGTGIPLTGVGMGAGGLQLPAGVRLATNPNPTTNCPGGTPTTGGTDLVFLAGANLDRRQGCTVSVSVVSDAAANYTAKALVSTFVSTQTYTNAAGQGDLLVLDAINFQQYFEPNSVAASATGNKAKMRLRLTNAAAAASAGTKLKFRLAGGLKLVGGAISNDCGGTLTLPPDGIDFDLAGAIIPAAGGAQGLGDDGFCEVVYEVLATGDPSTITNIVPTGALTNTAGQSNKTPIQSSLNLVPVNIRVNQDVVNVTPGDPNLGQPIITGGEPAELRVKLTNESGITVTNVNYLNVLPPDVLVYGVPEIDPATCTGAVINALPEDTKYSVNGITLAPGAACTFVFKITSLTSDNRDLKILVKDVKSTEGGTNAEESPITLTTRGNATVSKTITPNTIAAGGTAKLTLKVVNATVAPLTGVELADVFPVGMIVADIPNVTNTCNGTFTAPAGGAQVKLLGGTIPASKLCTLTVDITALDAKPYANTIPALALKTTEGRTNKRDITAALDVTGTSIVRPGLSLVKRITDIDGTAINALFNFTPAAGPDEDNAANWPGPVDPTAGISTYLRGAYEGAQAKTLQDNLKVGSTIEYTGYFLSKGNGPATAAELCDYLPKNTEYVAASLTAALGDGTVLVGQYLPPTTATFPTSCKGVNNGAGAVVVPLGNLANATAPGLPTTSYGSFKFKLKVK